MSGEQVSTAHIEKKFQKLIEDAQNNGDFQKVIELRERLEKEKADFITASKTLQNSGPLDTSSEQVTGLKLEKIIFKKDREVLSELMQIENFKMVRALIEQENFLNDPNRELLKTAMALEKDMTPQLYNVLERVKTILQLNKKLELYVYQSGNYNGLCRQSGENTLSIVLSSSIIENFEPNEISFLVGKYVGQHLFGHNQINIKRFLSKGADYLSPFVVMKLYSWSRNSEISSDRMGYLCADHFETVAKTFFKLSSGLSMQNIHFDVVKYISPFRDLKIKFNEENIPATLLHSSHPFAPIRIRSLEIFNQSRIYKEITGKGNGVFTKDVIEKKVEELTETIDPSFLNKNDQSSRNVQEFILLAGFAIALSNGVVDKEEVEALQSVVPKPVFADMIKKVNGKTMSELDQMIKVMINGPLKLYLTNNIKHMIIKNLALISYADGSIEEKEVHVIYRVCDYLAVQRSFADSIIHEVSDN